MSEDRALPRCLLPPAARTVRSKAQSEGERGRGDADPAAGKR